MKLGQFIKKIKFKSHIFFNKDKKDKDTWTVVMEIDETRANISAAKKKVPVPLSALKTLSLPSSPLSPPLTLSHSKSQRVPFLPRGKTLAHWWNFVPPGRKRRRRKKEASVRSRQTLEWLWRRASRKISFVCGSLASPVIGTPLNTCFRYPTVQPCKLPLPWSTFQILSPCVCLGEYIYFYIYSWTGVSTLSP